MTIVNVDPLVGASLYPTISQCIKLAADLNVAGVRPETVLPFVEQAGLRFVGVTQNSKPAVIRFTFNEVTFTVAGDSDKDLIIRDWKRAISGHISTKIGPYPRATLSEEELESEARIDAEKQRKSADRERQFLEQHLANTRYLGTPEDDVQFKYAPLLVGGHMIDLITPAHFDHLPKGTKLTYIGGQHVTKGVDFIDTDAHGGFMAFGLPSRAQDTFVYEGPFRSE